MALLVSPSHIVVPFVVAHMSSISRLLSRGASRKSIKQSREQEPEVIAISDETADEVFSALSSATARSILTTLYEQPRTASEIADEIDTSLQNVTYHLNKLSDSGLIEVVETWYSDQGKEMKVYVPTNEALVVFAGDDLRRSSVFEAVKRLVGFISIFAMISLIVEGFARQLVSRSETVSPGAGHPTGDPTMFVLSPGAVFFLGSLLALIVIAAWWHSRSF